RSGWIGDRRGHYSAHVREGLARRLQEPLQGLPRRHSVRRDLLSSAFAQHIARRRRPHPHDAYSPAVIVVAGPTGVGKSDLALRLAKTAGGEIVNFDSVQIYRG